ncbi:MAG: helix-turn-helix transcriptional regulator [Negativicoccus succinicivorans]|uniref:helix-turn-helix domain-containing protein n=1 Tax=Negativicoccus succinicivorans TaxID=620903 RepID=UPI0023520ADC|nr:helix-turn-helix transcriptional regulator [Negativicoccus succinicivorans]MBS5890556.1 helix-turn-helix transcriptional regulator [Negativicoccus succinicivorans]
MQVQALKGIIMARGMTQKEVAHHLGVTPKTFGLKLKRGVFGSDEIDKMIKLLEISDPMSIFFNK